MSALDISAQHLSDNVVCLYLEGELDLSTCGKADRELARAEEMGAEGVVLDLRGLEFIDSSGLRSILIGDSRAREAGRLFALIEGRERVHRVFRITRLDKKLRFIEDPSELAPRVPEGLGSAEGWPRELELTLPPEPAAAAAARHSLTGLDGVIEDGKLEDLQLLISELVTNSIRHAELEPADPIHVKISVWPERIRVEVTDGGPGFLHRPREAADQTDSGWGLYLVERISDRWGVNPSGEATVWFEFDR